MPGQDAQGCARRQRLDQEIDAEIGRRLRARRHDCMLTLQHLAEMSGLSMQQIQRSESGAARVTVVVLLRLAEALRIAPLALLPNLAPEETATVIQPLPDDTMGDGAQASAHDLALALAQYLWKQGGLRGGAG